MTTAAMRAEYAASAATTASSSGASASPMSTSTDTSHARDCQFCDNVKLLRDVLPGKKCDYCYQTKCQFCTLKFPLLNVKKGMPKSLKSNSRICAACFAVHWPPKSSIQGRMQRGVSSMDQSPPSSRRRDSEWHEPSDAVAGRESFDEAALHSAVASRVVATEESIPPSLLKRLASALGLVVSTKGGEPKQRDLIHVVELWISLFTAAVLLSAVLVQDLVLSHRLIGCTVVYGLFLAVHPWIHNTVVTTPVAVVPRTQTPQSSIEKTTTNPPPPVARPPSTRVPDVYRSTFVEMQQSFMVAVTDETKWKVVRSVTGGKVYEVATDRPQTLFMLDTFVSGITIAEFISFMNRTDVKDRALWDQNIAAFEVIESFADDNASVLYNAQKPFLGGLLSARDFCLLYTSTSNAIIYASVTHPSVPEKPNATRAAVYVAGYHCKEATNDKGEAGFMLKYVVQVDIRSSIPSRMVYNGTVDNLERMIKTFRNAKKVFASASK